MSCSRAQRSAPVRLERKCFDLHADSIYIVKTNQTERMNAQDDLILHFANMVFC